MLSKLKRKWRSALGGVLPLLPASILGDLGRILDKIFGICIILLVIIVILVVGWILSHFFGGGSRG